MIKNIRNVLYLSMLLLIGVVFSFAYTGGVAYADGPVKYTLTFESDERFGHFEDIDGNVIESVEVNSGSHYWFVVVYGDWINAPKITNAKVFDYISATVSGIGTNYSVSDDGKTIRVSGIYNDITIGLKAEKITIPTYDVTLPEDTDGYSITCGDSTGIEHSMLFDFDVTVDYPYTQNIDSVKVDLIDTDTGDVAQSDIEGILDDFTYSYSAHIYSNYTIAVRGLVLNEYTVNFYDEAGELVDTQVVTHGESAVSPDTEGLGVEGSRFKSWDRSLENITQDTDIYALFEPDWLVVTFLDYDGTLLGVDNNVSYNGSADPVEAVRTGYYFDKWVDNSGAAVDLNNVTESMTVYASYIKKHFTVVFMLGPEEIDTQSVEYMGAAVPPTVSLDEGYELIGWQDGYQEVKEDIIISAIYNIKSYDVKFYDARTGELLITKTVSHNSSCQVPYTEEYGKRVTVRGYYQESSKTSKFSFDQRITSDLDVYVDIEFEYRYISFYVDNSLYKKYVVKFGEKFDDIPSVPHKVGYDIVAPVWSKTEFNIVTEDETVNAIYTINVYEVKIIMPDKREVVYTINHGDVITSIPEYDVGFLERLNINLLDLGSITEDTVINVSVSKKYEIIFSVVGLLVIVLMFVVTMLVDSIVKDVKLRRKAAEDKKAKELERQRKEDEENRKRIKKLRF